MNLLLLTTVSSAAKPDFCRQDLTDVPIEWGERWGAPPEHLAMRALRPSLVRFQEDVCRCLPRHRQWPEMIEARMHVAPSQGEVVVTYHLTPPVSTAGLTLLACMRGATVTFEPFPYRTDMITEDGRVTTFTYPMKAELSDARTRKRALP